MAKFKHDEWQAEAQLTRESWESGPTAPTRITCEIFANLMTEFGDSGCPPIAAVS